MPFIIHAISSFLNADYFVIHLLIWTEGCLFSRSYYWYLFSVPCGAGRRGLVSTNLLLVLVKLILLTSWMNVFLSMRIFWYNFFIFRSKVNVFKNLRLCWSAFLSVTCEAAFYIWSVLKKKCLCRWVMASLNMICNKVKISNKWYFKVINII